MLGYLSDSRLVESRAWIAIAGSPLKEIDYLVDQVNSKRADLIISVVTYTEMLRAKHTPKQAAAFDDFLKRSNINRVDVSFPIAQKAEQIRSKAITMFAKHQQRSIKTPDAQIIATAIVHEADVFHSLEPMHHNLSGHAVVDGLSITTPKDISGQMSLL